MTHHYTVPRSTYTSNFVTCLHCTLESLGARPESRPWLRKLRGRSGRRGRADQYRGRHLLPLVVVRLLHQLRLMLLVMLLLLLLRRSLIAVGAPSAEAAVSVHFDAEGREAGTFLGSAAAVTTPPSGTRNRSPSSPSLSSSSSTRPLNSISRPPSIKVARWQYLIPSFPWIAPGWRVWGRNPSKRRDHILQRSVAES